MLPDAASNDRYVYDIVVIVLVGVASGTLNAIGGGGTFVALPALVAFGVPPVAANAVSRIALAPGAVASAWVARRDAAPLGGTSTRALTAVSVVGGALGAVLLLALPSESFDAALPWLLLFATLLLAFGGRLSLLIARAAGEDAVLGPRAVLAGQFVLALYGGYFGGAVGILMMALWSVGLRLDAAAGNPMRLVQLAAIYLGAGALFLFVPDVRGNLPLLLGMLAGAVAGGWAGAHLARRLSARLLKGSILTVAATTTTLYFLAA
ncbi:sulfite exporter TauE/SafE family protein [Streptomyces bohaiensis]|uniref:sulfite exporter TauE/SafE family protein n=1 Tax=Streptomyces bohaiensis TaxID=1431344 RepID=UPI0028B0F71F|nr:TSUP family transporter [Streptomyces bohaiensis]